MMEKNVVRMTQENFEQEVLSANLALVDFWAAWCGPCRMVGPVIASLAAQYEGRVTVGKVNVDEEGDLAIHYGVMSIPTVILFQDGVEIGRQVGVMPAEVYTDMLDAHL